MNKDQRALVSEYVSELSDDDVRYLSVRLHERYSDDLAEVLDAMSTDSEMDLILQSANGAFELYDMLDRIRDIVGKECKKRGVAAKSGPVMA